jgi:hypothetical protein
MEKTVDLVKYVRGTNSFINAVNTDFTELVTPVEETVQPNVTVEEFFRMYDQLFFDISPDGEINSHSYLINKSTEYIGGSTIDPEKEALIEEINSLRQQILDISESFLTTDKFIK